MKSTKRIRRGTTGLVCSEFFCEWSPQKLGRRIRLLPGGFDLSEIFLSFLFVFVFVFIVVA